MDILVWVVNVFVMGSSGIIATIMFVVYLLNLFKKRSVLESWGMYGDSERLVSFWGGVISAIFCLLGLVQNDKDFYGLSLGSTILLFLMAFVLFVCICEFISSWFKNLPES